MSKKRRYISVKLEPENKEPETPNTRKWHSLRPDIDVEQLKAQQHVKFRIDEVSQTNVRGKGAVLNLFGVDDQGHSVCQRVEGFDPYFYIKLPRENKHYVDEFVKELETDLLFELCRENHIPLERYGFSQPDQDWHYNDGFDNVEANYGIDDQDFNPVDFENTNKRFRSSPNVSRNFAGSGAYSVPGNKFFESFLRPGQSLEENRGCLIKKWYRVDAFPAKGYRKDPNTYFRINVAYPQLVSKCRLILQSKYTEQECTVAEANIDFTLRYMVDMNMRPKEWWQIKNHNKYAVPNRQKISHCQLEYKFKAPNWSNISIATAEKSKKSKQLHQIERCSDDVQQELNLGIDIQMTTDFEMCKVIDPSDKSQPPEYTRGFPKYDDSAIIGASAVFKQHTNSGYADEDEWVHYWLWLGTMDKSNLSHIRGKVEILEFPYVGDGTENGERSGCSRVDAERKMLKEYQRMMLAMDPDIVSGYNTNNFDFPFLTSRGNHLNITHFPYFGRLKNDRSDTRSDSKVSRAHGQIDSQHTRMTGRVQVDLLPILQKGRKLRSYTLSSVSQIFIGDQKEDMSYDDIPILQTTSEGRRKLAIYCDKDSVLPAAIMRKLITLVEQFQLAKANGITTQSLLQRGTQYRNRSLFTRKAAHNRESVGNAKNRSVPYLIHTKTKEEMEFLLQQEKYTGAIVIRSRSGYYVIPVVTLDFSGLYPSIMRAHNLCPTTYVDVETCDVELTEDDYYSVPDFYEHDDTTVEDGKPIPMFVQESAQDFIELEQNQEYKEKHSPTGYVPNLPDKFQVQDRPNAAKFVYPHVKKGLVPEILEELTDLRNQYKRKMASYEEGSFMYMVYNFMQMAVKVCANSLYGLFGSVTSFITLIDLALAVTTIGRGMLLQTQYKSEYCFLHFLRWLLYDEMKFSEKDLKIGMLQHEDKQKDDFADAGDKANGFFSKISKLTSQTKAPVSKPKDQDNTVEEKKLIPMQQLSKQMQQGNCKIKQIVPTNIPRMVLEEMKYEVRQIKNFEFCSRIVYGDTDSVFTLMLGCDLEDALHIGVIMAKYITLFFNKPINLEFEKVFKTILLLKKKKYAGKKYFYSGPKIDSETFQVAKEHKITQDKSVSKSGVEAVRRDNCKMVSRVVGTTLDLLLENEENIDKEYFTSDIKKEKQLANEKNSEWKMNRKQRLQMTTEFIQKEFRRLKQGNVPFCDLIVSKQLSKSFEAYLAVKTTSGNPKDPPGHVKLAMDLDKRSKAGEDVHTYTIGDRIPYVVVEFNKDGDKKISDAYRDPLEAWLGEERISFNDYADNQMCKAIARVFAPIFQHETRGMKEEHANDYMVEKVRQIMHSGEIINENYTEEQRIENAIHQRGNNSIKKNLFGKQFASNSCILCSKTIIESVQNTSIGSVSRRRRTKKDKSILCRRCALDRRNTTLIDTLMKKIKQEQETKGNLMDTCNNCFSTRYGFEHAHPVNRCQQTDCDVFWNRLLNTRNLEQYSRLFLTATRDIRMHKSTESQESHGDMEDLF